MTPVSLRWVRHALLAAAFAWGGAVFGCSTEKVTFVPDPVPPPPVDMMDAGDGEAPPPPPPPPSTPVACVSDDDCAGLSSTGVCDDAAGYCVECDPAREAELGRCVEGTFCAENGTCVLGCQENTDCRELSCDGDSKLCIHCTLDSDCTPGTTCIDAVCTPGCVSDDTCPGGWSCCDGLCRNLGTDMTSCGTCGNACDVMGACWNGICGEGPCMAGMAECDGDAMNGCETPVTGDAKNCGKCGRTCASNFCAGGECTTKECAPGTADCNGNEDDHCETDLGSVDDCVMCGLKCDGTHGEPSCTKDGCAIACDDGYEDCDAKLTNGCEIDLQTDDEHCGDCDTVCDNEHGTTECTDGECVPRCATGWSDCDGDASNGCETDTDTSEAHCGACGQKCNPDNAAGTCTDGVCKVKCDADFKDCDGSAKNGCEADLTAPETCGSCDNFCSDNGGKATCADPETGACTITCDKGRADCINGVEDGCETDLTVSVDNCGACGTVCTSSVGEPACRSSVCGVSTCSDPNLDCEGPDDEDCETNGSNDVDNCGGCAKACYYKNGTGVCSAKTCALDECDTDYADCNKEDTDGCETLLGTQDNCRTCGESCTNEHGNNECTSAGCVPECQTGWGDCDGNKNNGCETQLNTLTDCGKCGQSCTKAHAIPTCASGTCEIETCSTNWEDCSGNEGTAKDGCETQLHTSTNCEGCGLDCNLAHGSSSCSTGTCKLTGCSSGYANCNTSEGDGCEVQLGRDANCAACGDSCVNAHGSNSCTPVTASSWVCKPVCSKDGGGKDTYGDCDGKLSNGCETDLRTTTNCGACGTACNLANATAACAAGTCTISTCNSNYLSCDANDGNGCETPRGDNLHCRTCTESCTNAHGVSSCSLTTGCNIVSCDADYDDCDTDKTNGCEASLRTLIDCGTCGDDCDFPTSSESCSTGTCVATTCAPDYDDCDSSDSDCETQLNSIANCNACGHVCTPLNGNPTCTGAVGSRKCSPGCNFGFASCDGDDDNGCEQDIKTLSACGACNANCSFANAAASCNVVPSTSITCTMGSCTSGFFNCDSSTSNGCETAQGVSNCGGCGIVCDATHAPNACTSGACVPSCTGSGYGDCDTSRPNGCETALNTNSNCGGCGTTCTRAHATPTCTTGSCKIGSCDANWGNCNTTDSDGCEKATNTTADCGTCGHTCTALNGTPTCSSGVCNPGCNPASLGYDSCDGNPDNGCEKSVRTLTDCGSCNNPCGFTNASASCTTGTCTFGSCNSGYRSCDGTTANGCETAIDEDNCEGCGVGCSNSHGTTSCDVANAKCLPVCAPASGIPTGDCDSSRANGCEATLNSTTNCGACGNACASNYDCVPISGNYRCQARVKYENDTETNVSGSPPSINLSHGLTLTSAAQRIVIAGIVAQVTNTTSVVDARPTTVTYGGVNMTHMVGTTNIELANTASNAFDTGHIYLYYLTDTGTNKLPASNTPVPSLIVNVPSGKVTTLGAQVVEFSGVDQTTPIILGTNRSVSFPGSSCAATSSVTTPALAGAALYALTNGHYYGTPITANGLTEIWSTGSIGTALAIRSGYKDSVMTVLAASTPNTIGFTYNWCSPAGVIPIAIGPYRQP